MGRADSDGDTYAERDDRQLMGSGNIDRSTLPLKFQPFRTLGNRITARDRLPSVLNILAGFEAELRAPTAPIAPFGYDLSANEHAPGITTAAEYRLRLFEVLTAWDAVIDGLEANAIDAARQDLAGDLARVSALNNQIANVNERLLIELRDANARVAMRDGTLQQMGETVMELERVNQAQAAQIVTQRETINRQAVMIVTLGDKAHAAAKRRRQAGRAR